MHHVLPTVSSIKASSHMKGSKDMQNVQSMAKNTLIPSHQRADTAEVHWSPAWRQQPVNTKMISCLYSYYYYRART